MSTLYWLRMARKAKLYKQPEYPHVEALLEAEADKPGEDFRLLARIIPAGIVVFGLATAIVATIAQRNLWLLMSTIGAGAIAIVVWAVFDHFAKKVSPSKARVRKLSKEVVQRVCGFSNLVGVEPALSPAVGPVLDEAAAIYLKHCSEHSTTKPATPNEQRIRAERALEDAMAKMMELAMAPSARTQELELAKGWFMPLLDEMRKMDVALSRYSQEVSASQLSDSADPLANLREARLEIMGNETALSELRQNLSE